MRAIAFLTQKGGAGKTTLATSLAVAAAAAGERVIALDLDPQASLMRWAMRRQARGLITVVVETFESERLPSVHAIFEGLAAAGFTLAIVDTPNADTAAIRFVAQAADLCLLPVRPTLLDVEATAATFRAVFLAKRKAAFVISQCPPLRPSRRTNEAAKDLIDLGVLAEPMVSARIDFQDAVAAGQGVTEYARDSKAAKEVMALWEWTRSQFTLDDRHVAA
jgi:chromosome partitioning protein